MTQTMAAAFGFALDIALKATLLFSVTALAVALLARSGAAARHFVGTAGLIGALALPLLTLLLPPLPLPLFSSPVAHAVKPAPRKSPQASLAASPRLEEWDRSGAVPNSKKDLDGAPVSSEASPSPAPATRIPWLPLAIVAWAAGVLLVASRLAVGVRRVARLKHDAEPIRDPDWRQEADLLSQRLAVRRPVALYESPRIPVAITSGIFRPFLLLCRQARLWAAERRRVVLLHELAHVKRGDWIWLLLAEAALALYWWHPLAWLLTRQVRRDGEKACDDLVLAAGTKPSVYAGHLLGIFRSLSSAAHPVAPAVATARPSHFEGRLRAILDPAGPRRELPRMRATLSAAALLVSAAGIAAVSPWIPCSDSAVARPVCRLSPAVSLKAPSGAAPTGSSDCPSQRRSPAARPAAAVRTAANASSSPSPSASSEGSPSEDPIPESGRTLPAILKGLDSLRIEAAGFVRASRRFTDAGRKSGSDWYGRAMDLHHDGRYDEAIAAFEKAIAGSYREDAASYNIACGYARKGDRDKAFEWLRRAMEAGFDVEKYLGHDDDLDGLKPDPRWRELKKQLSRQPSARLEREGAVAAARYERLAAKAPKDGEPYYNIGKDLLNAGRYDLSARAFGEASARGYRVGTSLYNQACALSRAGQTRAALDLLEKALDAGFDQPGLFDKDDDLDNVRDDPRFAQIAREARDLSLPGYGIGDWARLSSERRSKWREAARRFEEYARAHSQKGRAWFNLGFASLAGDRPEAAVEAFGKAFSLGYRKPTTLYNLACSHARLDQKDTAFDYLFKALDSGFDAAGTLRGDEDLDNLRGDPRFRKALEMARAREKSEDD